MSNNIEAIITALDIKSDIYPAIRKVIVAQNFNSNITKRLLWDFLDIYSDDFNSKIKGPNNLIQYTIKDTPSDKTYFIDFSSSGIFEQVPDDVNNTEGENIEEFAKVIQTLCDSVPINLDVRGVFSGISNKSTIQEKALCKMRLAAMILDVDTGNSSSLFTKSLDFSYHKFSITSENDGENKVNYSNGQEPKIVCWGHGVCNPPDPTSDGDKPLFTTEFNFKITQFQDKSSPPQKIYVVSVSSAFNSSLLTLLPLPDYFVTTIPADVNKKNYLVSPGHCIGFSRKGTYNVKFVITQEQYNLVFGKPENNGKYVPLADTSLNFVAVIPMHTNISKENPFPGVLWTISGKSGSSSAPASAPPPPSALKEPSVTTDDPSSVIADTSATIGGTITDKNDNIKETGFHYIKTTTELSTDGDGTNQKISYDSTNNQFKINITGLTPDTEYYFQAYITYQEPSGTIKTIYGEYKKFKTTNSSAPAKKNPSVTTNSPPINITTTSATISAKFLNPDSLTIRYFAFLFSSERITADNIRDTNIVKKVKGEMLSDNNTFTCNLTDLTQGNDYYYLAYINYTGGTKKTAYGAQQKFTTLSS